MALIKERGSGLSDFKKRSHLSGRQISLEALINGRDQYSAERWQFVFCSLEVRYPDARKDHLDGLTVMCDAWWFNVGASNTEPLMRLNLEANDVALRDKKRDEALRIIQKADPVMSIRQ